MKKRFFVMWAALVCGMLIHLLVSRQKLQRAVVNDPEVGSAVFLPPMPSEGPPEMEALARVYNASQTNWTMLIVPRTNRAPTHYE